MAPSGTAALSTPPQLPACAGQHDPTIPFIGTRRPWIHSRDWAAIAERERNRRRAASCRSACRPWGTTEPGGSPVVRRTAAANSGNKSPLRDRCGLRPAGGSRSRVIGQECSQAAAQPGTATSPSTIPEPESQGTPSFPPPVRVRRRRKGSEPLAAAGAGAGYPISARLRHRRLGLLPRRDPTGSWPSSQILFDGSSRDS